MKVKDNPELELLLKLKYGTPHDPEYFARLPASVVENAYAICKEFTSTLSNDQLLGTLFAFHNNSELAVVEEMREYLRVLYAVGGYQKIEQAVGQSLILYHSLLGRV